MADFISYAKTNNVIQVIELYFREVIKAHDVPRSIVSYRDIKFLSHF